MSVWHYQVENFNSNLISRAKVFFLLINVVSFDGLSVVIMDVRIENKEVEKNLLQFHIINYMAFEPLEIF